MAMTRDVIVQFITKLNDKGIKNATKSTQKYEGALGKVSKIGIAAYAALSAAAIKFGEMSVKNALADEKAQRILALSLKNSAGASQGVIDAADAQIDKIQRLTGVSDDQLRPALSRIVRSTSEVSSAFDMLNLAIDISKGTQKDLGAVSIALSKAVDGNFIALQRLGVGIDKDVLATKDFNKIFGELRRNFAGFAAAEADTVEGKIARLKVAADEASEVIGESLVNAIIAIGSSAGSIEETTKNFDKLAQSIADTITGLGKFISFFTNFNTAFLGFSEAFDEYVKSSSILGAIFRVFREEGEQTRIELELAASAMRQVTSARNAEMQATVDQKKALADFVKGLKAEEAKQRAAAKAAADRAKQEKIAALEKAKSDRDAFLRQQLAAQVDTDKMSLQVALTRKLSEEDKTRVNALIALQEDDVTKQMNSLAEMNDLYTKHYGMRLAAIGKIKEANEQASAADRPFGGFLTPRNPQDSVASRGAMDQFPGLDLGLGNLDYLKPPTTPDPFITQGLQDFFAQDFGGSGMAPSLADMSSGYEGSGVPNVTVNVAGSLLTEGDLGFYISNLIGNLNRQGNTVTLTNLGR